MTSENSAQEAAPAPAVPVDDFAARLMLARKHAGNLTISEAAARCGLVGASWSNWERGMVPRGQLEIAEAVAEGLGVDLFWLLRGGALTRDPGSRPRRARLLAAAKSRSDTEYYPTILRKPSREPVRVIPTQRSGQRQQPAGQTESMTTDAKPTQPTIRTGRTSRLPR